MGYKQFLRSVAAAERRMERESLRRHRELMRHAQKQERLQAKEAERERAAHEVAVFENYLEVLVSVHKDCGELWEWKQLASASPPSQPSQTSARESRAREELARYQPGFFERLFGKAKKRTAELQAAIERAVSEDRSENDRATQEHRSAHALWDLRRKLAADVLRNDVDAYRRALKHVDPYAEMAAFRTRVDVHAAEPDVLTLNCILEDEELVPREELKLTATGKVSTKELAASRYWSLHQDHICSCALRIARETFAALPVNSAVINFQTIRLDSSTGHMAATTLLAVRIERAQLQRLNLNAIDPSDSMKNFPHRMKFKKTTGFEGVEAMTADEQWVTTS